MALVVQKYGGTSVADIHRIKRVAERVIKEYKRGNQLVVVVSAMGDTTDKLIRMMRGITTAPDPREADMLLTTGEQVSIALLCMAIQEMGFQAISLTGGQARINTDDRHNRAEITGIETSRIYEELQKGKIVVVAGFQGVNSREDYTTLGRGGSDTTAVALAASLGAEWCEIYSDVDGIYTTDPRVVKEARKLESISYDEMLELASLGAKVLHPRSVELAKAYGVKLYIASSFNYRTGTTVERIEEMEKRKNVTGVTANKDEVKVTVQLIPDKPGVAGRLFTQLAENGLNIDMIVQNIQHDNLNDITFTINKEDYLRGKQIIKQIAAELGSPGVEIDTTVAKVSIVGAGMISTPGIAARMFTALGEAGINIQLISTADIKVSCLVKEGEADQAVKVLHGCFQLHAGDEQLRYSGEEDLSL